MYSQLYLEVISKPFKKEKEHLIFIINYPKSPSMRGNSRQICSKLVRSLLKVIQWEGARKSFEVVWRMISKDPSKEAPP
jgi:hypothetical protein